MTDNKQQAFNPGFGYPQQQPPPYSEMPTGGSAYPPYPTAGGYPQQVGGYPQQGGYPPQQPAFNMGGGGYPQGPGYGAAPMGGMPGVGFPQAGGYGMGGGFGGPPMMGPMAGFRVPLDPEDRHEEPKPYVDGNADGMAFSDKTIRMAFIRKVYSILMVQLAATTAIIALFCFHDGVKHWMRTGPGAIFMIVCMVVAIILLFAISCCESVRRKSPANIILLGIFTLTYGVLIGAISSKYNASVVVLAFGITVVVCLSLTLFSFQTKIDFTAMGGTLFVCCIVLMLFGLLATFLGRTYPILHLVYAACGTLLFSVYLIHDTQAMMGGKRYSLSPEEYIFAALNIYTDVIMIFTNLLTLLGYASD